MKMKYNCFSFVVVYCCEPESDLIFVRNGASHTVGTKSLQNPGRQR